MFFPEEKTVEMMEKESHIFPNLNPKRGFCMQVAESVPNPRTIKTHLPISMVNPKIFEEAKVINHNYIYIVPYHHKYASYEEFRDSNSQI